MYALHTSYYKDRESMKQEAARNLDAISKVFPKLSTEKQENVLKTARSLLQIQAKDAYSIKQKRKAKNESH
jgi:hypothetical protein